MTEEQSNTSDLLGLTVEIVSAHVANNALNTSEVPSLIKSVFGALLSVGAPAPAPTAEKQEPAVSIRSSVKPDYIVCLEDGAKLKMLKRYLRTRYNMSPEEYRAKWNLPLDYPMAAPNYSEHRRMLAKSIGLGTRPAAKVTPAKAAKAPAKAKAAATAKPAAKRGRPAKAVEA